MASSEQRPEVLPLASVQAHPRNYKTYPQDQIAHLRESIRAHGLYRNIVVARDNTILAGHGVVEAARQMGLETVPVVRLDLDPFEPRALKVLAGDNEVMHLGERDDRALSELLKEVSTTDVDGLLGTGYDEAMLATLAMVTRPASEIADFDAAAAWAGMPDYDEGEARPKLVVNFRSEEDRERLIAQLGLRINQSKGGVSTWWPPKDGHDDLAALQFEAAT